MANQDESCGCENDHSQDLSNRLLKLFQQFKECKDPYDRAAIANEIAEVSLNEHDFTDPNMNDSYHQYFEEFQRARDEYDRASLKVARLTVNVIEEYLNSKELTVEAALGVSADKSVN